MSGTKSKTSKSSKSDSGQIVATSQTSRFHVDTLTTLSREIDLHQVNISVGIRDILIDAHLRLKTGVKYGLVGRNGQGKSSTSIYQYKLVVSYDTLPPAILKAIADKIIPGIPENLRILLVGQVEGALSLFSDEDKEQPTVVQVVVRSDSRRETALWEHKSKQRQRCSCRFILRIILVLSTGLESDSEVQLLEAVVTLRHARALKELELAQKIAAKRSGARGADARKQLLVCEKQVADLEAGLCIANARIFQINAEATESNVRVILLGLGFSSEQLDDPYTSLSGGWRSRCTLGSALLQKPDLLILDEPTNYLDIPSVVWLQNYLTELEDTTILVVAHDRDFLDEATEETIILREQKLAYHEGAISACERAGAKKRKSKVRMKDALDKKREAIEKTIAEGARAARKTGDENKARMVKSRQKKLDNRWGAEVNDKGHKCVLHLGGFHLTSRAEIEIESIDPPVNLPFPDPEDLRFPGTLCSAANVTYQYSKAGPIILDDVTITVHPGDRVGLVGKNGEGKSTLVKMLIGQLKPTKGVVERHPRLRIGYGFSIVSAYDYFELNDFRYYSQHSVEELTDPKVGAVSSVVHFIEESKNRHGIVIDDGTARGFLGSFGLQGRIATNPISTLSGGQKIQVRLALALIVYPAPDLLVLDEVSTHLDMDTNVGLMRALRRFKGAVLLVSHDRHLIRCVIEGDPLIPEGDELSDVEEDETSDTDDPVKTGVVYRVGPKGKLRKLENGVNQYVADIQKRLK
ncbi:ABC transporter, putative [Rhizoctonia solani AG-1 IA]|uniref:ABC transporter, putative n=1 Tax=Thanatephorus cucumeris (strain AG1-IA) TaxID=983506 RepID=L8WGV7_THACA|nr:ABC transporter, putative [Rhizoctonia solani AG-1 IA]